MARQTRKSKSSGSPIATNLMEQLRALDEQRQTLMAGAKSEALKAAEVAVAALNSLGFNYRLSQGSARQARGTGRSGGRARQVKDAPCPICGFKTSPPHDRRAHRGQKDKKPFTAAELEQKGMKRV